MTSFDASSAGAEWRGIHLARSCVTNRYYATRGIFAGKWSFENISLIIPRDWVWIPSLRQWEALTSTVGAVKGIGSAKCKPPWVQRNDKCNSLRSTPLQSCLFILVTNKLKSNQDGPSGSQRADKLAIPRFTGSTYKKYKKYTSDPDFPSPTTAMTNFNIQIISDTVCPVGHLDLNQSSSTNKSSGASSATADSRAQ